MPIKIKTPRIGPNGTATPTTDTTPPREVDDGRTLLALRVVASHTTVSHMAPPTQGVQQHTQRPKRPLTNCARDLCTLGSICSITRREVAPYGIESIACTLVTPEQCRAFVERVRAIGDLRLCTDNEVIQHHDAFGFMPVSGGLGLRSACRVRRVRLAALCDTIASGNDGAIKVAYLKLNVDLERRMGIYSQCVKSKYAIEPSELSDYGVAPLAVHGNKTLYREIEVEDAAFQKYGRDADALYAARDEQCDRVDSASRKRALSHAENMALRRSVAADCLRELIQGYRDILTGPAHADLQQALTSVPWSSRTGPGTSVLHHITQVVLHDMDARVDARMDAVDATTYSAALFFRDRAFSPLRMLDNGEHSINDAVDCWITAEAPQIDALVRRLSATAASKNSKNLETQKTTVRDRVRARLAGIEQRVRDARSWAVYERVIQQGHNDHSRWLVFALLHYVFLGSEEACAILVASLMTPS